MDDYNKRSVLFKKFLLNKVVFKKIVNFIKETNSIYLWNRNTELLRDGKVAFKNIPMDCTPNMPIYQRRSYIMLDPEWILKNNYIQLLIDKLRILHVYYHKEQRMIWSAEACLLLTDMIRDQPTLQLVADTLTEQSHQKALLEGSARNKNTFLFTAVSSIGYRWILRDERVMLNFFLIAIESGSLDIAKFIINKYSFEIPPNQASTLLDRAIMSQSIDTIYYIFNSPYYTRTKKGLPISTSQIFQWCQLDYIQNYFKSFSSQEFANAIERYESECIENGPSKFGWKQFEILKFGYSKLVDLNHYPDLNSREFNLQMEIKNIFDRKYNLYNLEQNTMLPYFNMVQMMAYLGSKNIINTYNHLLSVLNWDFIDSLVNILPYSFTTRIFPILLEHGNLEALKRYSRYKDNKPINIKSISKTNTLEILYFLIESMDKVTIDQTVLKEQIILGNIPAVFYLMDDLGLHLENPIVDIVNAFENGHIDLAVELIKRTGVQVPYFLGKSNKSDYQLALHYCRLCKEFGVETIVINERTLYIMVFCQLKDQLEMAVKRLNPIDPIAFVLNCDPEGLYEALENNLCSRYTLYSDHCPNGSIGLLNKFLNTLGECGSPVFYRAYESITVEKHSQWERKVYQGAKRFSHTKLLKIIKDIDD